MIYTSYYGNWRNFPDNSVTIQISTSVPKGFTPSTAHPLVYPIYSTMVGPIKEGRITEQEYTDMYLKMISENESLILDFYSKLHSWSSQSGQDIILLCYCAKGKFCHRRILAKFLSEKLNIKVEEL